MKKTLKSMPVSFYVGAVILFVILLMIFFPGLFTDQDPYTQDMNVLLQAPWRHTGSGRTIWGETCTPG